MEILENISLAEYTTFRIGGPARFFCIVKSEGELLEAIKFSKENGLRVFVLGGGSNILVSDSGFDGVVIKINLEGISFEDAGDREVLVRSSAGENWDKLVAKTTEKNLWGLENLSGIPGTVGAAPIQNIGAYGSEVKDTIVEVRAIDVSSGAGRVFSNTECLFGYRDSFFKAEEGKKYIITEVAFRLSKKSKPNLTYKDFVNSFTGKATPALSEIREAVLSIRKGKFPDLSEAGTAGSFWKNPVISKEQFEELKNKFPEMPSFPSGEKVKVPLAWILDNVCGMKGYKKGPVALYEKQPLVLVADIGAKKADVENLAFEVASKVKEMTGIEIEREVGSL